jgi:hypothetical protein
MVLGIDSGFDTGHFSEDVFGMLVATGHCVCSPHGCLISAIIAVIAVAVSMLIVSTRLI